MSDEIQLDTEGESLGDISAYVTEINAPRLMDRTIFDLTKGLPRATFSRDLRYRYTLSRETGLTNEPGMARLLFIMLNPSTADETKDDPTIRRCIGFARRWLYGELVVCNLFALRTTDPKRLDMNSDPIGPANDATLLNEANHADFIVCAWGNWGDHLGRGYQVADFLRAEGHLLYCLGETKHFQPSHPLYLRKNTAPRLWESGLTDGGGDHDGHSW